MAEMSEALQYISDKRVLMSAPGTKLNDIYYTRLNSTVELVESTFTQGRVLQSLTSFVFGSSSQVVIPIGSFLGETYLHLHLPALVAGQSLVRGWGLAAIQSISYLFGSSNVSQITINNQSLMQVLLAQCETEDKASEMFRLAGQELTGPTASDCYADILLPFPWSALNGLHIKKPFDTTLLMNPITIIIQFNQANSFYGGPTPPGQNSFSEATVLYRTGDLTQKSLSLKDTLMRNPEMMYSYPFIYAQSYVSQSFNGSTSLASPVNIQIQNFINADLVGMTFCAVLNSNLSVASGSNNSPSPFNYAPITDIQLQLNGQYLFQMPYEQYKLINMQSSLGGGFFHNSVLGTYNTVTQTFPSTPVDSYPVFCDFSRLRAASFIDYVQNTFRIGNNTMNFIFRTPDTSVYTLFVTIFYNAVAEIGNGETRIYLN